jgi:hypothetical protein
MAAAELVYAGLPLLFKVGFGLFPVFSLLDVSMARVEDHLVLIPVSTIAGHEWHIFILENQLSRVSLIILLLAATIIAFLGDHSNLLILFNFLH